MAQTELTVTCRVAWWVAPYLRIAALAWSATSLFVDLDAEDEDAYIERQSAFVMKHGICLRANGKAF